MRCSGSGVTVWWPRVSAYGRTPTEPVRPLLERLVDERVVVPGEVLVARRHVVEFALEVGDTGVCSVQAPVGTGDIDVDLFRWLSRFSRSFSSWARCSPASRRVLRSMATCCVACRVRSLIHLCRAARAPIVEHTMAASATAINSAMSPASMPGSPSAIAAVTAMPTASPMIGEMAACPGISPARRAARTANGAGRDGRPPGPRGRGLRRRGRRGDVPGPAGRAQR